MSKYHEVEKSINLIEYLIDVHRKTIQEIERKLQLLEGQNHDAKAKTQ